MMTITSLPEIVRRAMAETVCDVGQLSKSESYQLNKYVRKGWLSKGKAGPFPKLKTVYAVPGFDFATSRERHVNHIIALAELETQIRGKCCACGKNHRTEQRRDK